ncbi:hypothetical protein CB1_000804021 [Camelus ferus]|nr:hypothetical protein CB1_000804021 [Camelus ferus]
MSALTRLAPFVRFGGHFFGGRRVRAAGGCGVRHAGGGVHIEPRYRQFPQLTRSQVIQAEFFSGTMWFWILWRLWHDSDAVLNYSVEEGNRCLLPLAHQELQRDNRVQWRKRELPELLLTCCSCGTVPCRHLPEQWAGSWDRTAWASGDCWSASTSSCILEVTESTHASLQFITVITITTKRYIYSIHKVHSSHLGNKSLTLPGHLSVGKSSLEIQTQ